jgi:hypothetical protein
MSDPTYCWSTDEEEFYGDCPSREAAIADAEDSIAGDYEPGDITTIWTAEIRPAMYFLRQREMRIGQYLIEQLDEWLIDDIAAEEVIIEMERDNCKTLGKSILDYLEEHASFNRYGVANTQAHQITISPEEAA